jgi:hypothetical protein
MLNDRLQEDEKIEAAAQAHATFLARSERTVGEQLSNAQLHAERLGLEFKPSKLENCTEPFVDPTITRIRQRAQGILRERASSRAAYAK